MSGTRFIAIGLLTIIISAMLLSFAMIVAFGQNNHAAGHNLYQGWASKKINNCCNNEDCGVLSSSEWRNTNTGTEVRVFNEWCPVLSEHRVIQGKSPDASRPHACVDRKVSSWRKGCDRLLCFMGDGGA